MRNPVIDLYVQPNPSTQDRAPWIRRRRTVNWRVTESGYHVVKCSLDGLVRRHARHGGLHPVYFYVNVFDIGIGTLRRLDRPIAIDIIEYKIHASSTVEVDAIPLPAVQQRITVGIGRVAAGGTAGDAHPRSNGSF